MNKSIILILSTFCFLGNAYGHNLPIKYSKNISNEQKSILDNTLNEIEGLLPSKFKESLPAGIVLDIAKLSDHNEIPKDVCDLNSNKKNEKKFIYGEYNQLTNTLKLNLPVVNEFKKGRNLSTKINCQHKSLYDQALSTIIHELTHAYDKQVGNISNTTEYLRRAGFKKGLLKVKNKNIDAMRSEDEYELTNVRESFAVNMEYFLMDEEFACRRPSLFDFFKAEFGIDPYPSRNCKLNTTVMMSTQQGYFPYNLDPKRVYRIDYLMASPGSEVSSGFGHSMFRLVVCAPERLDPISGKIIPKTPFGKTCLEDKLYHIVVSYRANVEDATLNYFKGILGGYPSMLFILNLGDVLDEYNRDELRDVFAYPLKLSDAEKNDVVKKVIEEHWNYRGAYKFFTSNCATESLDLLKASLYRNDLNSVSSITPKGVLNDLDQVEILSKKSDELELFKAKTEQLSESMKLAYNIKTKNTKEDKKKLLKFIDESKVEDRTKSFADFMNSSVPNLDLHGELFELKKRLVKSSSFSVVEQQILRSFAAKLRKKAADMYFNTKDPELKKVMDEITNKMKTNFTDLSKNGYGVPLESEMVSGLDLNAKLEKNQETVKQVEDVFKKLMANEYESLINVSENISKMNEYSIAIRKEYRSKLDKYVLAVMNNLKNTDEGIQTLQGTIKLDKNAIKNLRQLLDSNLVSDKEITDAKLSKIANEIMD